MRVATNRVGQTFILAAAGVMSQWFGVEAAFALLALVMLVTAGAGALSARGGRSVRRALSDHRRLGRAGDRLDHQIADV